MPAGVLCLCAVRTHSFSCSYILGGSSVPFLPRNASEEVVRVEKLLCESEPTAVCGSFAPEFGGGLGRADKTPQLLQLLSIVVSKGRSFLCGLAVTVSLGMG